MKEETDFLHEIDNKLNALIHKKNLMEFISEKRAYIIKNELITPDGTKLRCMHRHDFQSHFDEVIRQDVINDGLGHYTRRTIHSPEDWKLFKDNSVDLNCPLKDLREVDYFASGSGKSFKYLTIKELSNEQLSRWVDAFYLRGNYEIMPLIKAEIAYRLNPKIDTNKSAYDLVLEDKGLMRYIKEQNALEQAEKAQNDKVVKSPSPTRGM